MKKRTTSSTKSRTSEVSEIANKKHSLGSDIFSMFKDKLSSDFELSLSHSEIWWDAVSSPLKSLGDTFVVRFMAPIIKAIGQASRPTITPAAAAVDGEHFYPKQREKWEEALTPKLFALPAPPSKPTRSKCIAFDNASATKNFL